MTREEFDKILIEEGYKDKLFRDSIWDSRPTDDLREAPLRATARLMWTTYVQEKVSEN